MSCSDSIISKHGSLEGLGESQHTHKAAANQSQTGTSRRLALILASGAPCFVRCSLNRINSLIGRHANRITGGLFSLDGVSYQLERNNLGNHLHGGANGFNSKCMASKILNLATDPVSKLKYVGVEMSFVSPDGDEGYPGELAVTTRFKLLEDNTLQMDFLAQLQGRDDQPSSTIVNLCNHAYWNLNGTEGRESVLGHTLRVNALARTELDDQETMLPTGRIIPLAGTAYDFSGERQIGGELMDSLEKALPAPAGYDNNYVLLKLQDHVGAQDQHQQQASMEAARAVDIDGAEQRLSFAAKLADPVSGRSMAVYTTAPGVQVYTGNFLDGSSVVGRGGVAYAKNAGICLETQSFPDAINHHSSADAYKNFPSGILRRGDKYIHVTQHKFTTTIAAAAAAKA